MKYNYPQLTNKCAKCLYKCQRCEDENFKGVWRCENFIEKEQKKNEV